MANNPDGNERQSWQSRTGETKPQQFLGKYQRAALAGVALAALAGGARLLQQSSQKPIVHTNAQAEPTPDDSTPPPLNPELTGETTTDEKGGDMTTWRVQTQPGLKRMMREQAVKEMEKRVRDDQGGFIIPDIRFGDFEEQDPARGDAKPQRSR